MKIIGVDPAKVNTGIVLLEDGHTVLRHTTVYCPKGGNFAEALHDIMSVVIDYAKDGASCVGIERPYHRMNPNTLTLISMSMAAAVIGAYGSIVEHAIYKSSEWRKIVFGKSPGYKGDEWKAAAKAKAKGLSGLDLSEDEAEAMLIARACYIEHMVKIGGEYDE